MIKSASYGLRTPSLILPQLVLPIFSEWFWFSYNFVFVAEEAYSLEIPSALDEWATIMIKFRFSFRFTVRVRLRACPNRYVCPRFGHTEPPLLL